MNRLAAAGVRRSGARRFAADLRGCFVWDRPTYAQIKNELMRLFWLANDHRRRRHTLVPVAVYYRTHPACIHGSRDRD